MGDAFARATRQYILKRADSCVESFARTDLADLGEIASGRRNTLRERERECATMRPCQGRDNDGRRENCSTARLLARAHASGRAKAAARS